MSPDGCELSGEQHRLLLAVENFDIDGGPVVLPFVRRLARENGWSLNFAGRVIREYKRFALLAKVTGGMVSPSDSIDQAWHLHLLYTISYWKRFCGDVLDMELHHFPSRGDSVEDEKFRDCYARTIANYERYFGESPPPDIWPDPESQITNAWRSRWVNANRYWIVPKNWRTPFLAGIVVWALLLVTELVVR
jgi:hypothetical protein